MAGTDAAGDRPRGRLAKVLALPPEDVGRLAEAVIAVLAARVALRFFRMEALALAARRIALASAGGPTEPPGGPAREGVEEEASLAWAADAASGVLGVTCLPRSLGLCWLLARRGLPADLCLGSPRSGPRLPWHAWVELDGNPLGGASAAAGEGGVVPFDLVCRLPLRPSAAPGSTSGL